MRREDLQLGQRVWLTLAELEPGRHRPRAARVAGTVVAIDETDMPGARIALDRTVVGARDLNTTYADCYAAYDELHPL